MSDLDSTDQPLLPGFPQLLEFAANTPDGKSNTIELFDALAVYSLERPRDGQRFIETEKRFRGRTYRVRMSPVAIKTATGEFTTVLPGARENLTEKALRKIAADGQNRLGVTESDGNAEVWVYFTLYQLRRTLADQGHDFKIAQLTEALEVLSGAKLKVTSETPDDVAGVESGLLQTLKWRQQKRGDPDGRKHWVAAKLHPFITRSILQRSFRMIDFAKLMRPKSELARWFYTRLSHNYTQADEADLFHYRQGDKTAGYHLSLSTIMKETGMRHSDMRSALRAVRTALKVLRMHDVLLSKDWMSGKDFQGWCEEVSYGPSQGGRKPIADVIFTLFPSQAVIDDIISANKLNRTPSVRK